MGDGNERERGLMNMSEQWLVSELNRVRAELKEAREALAAAETELAVRTHQVAWLTEQREVVLKIVAGFQLRFTSANEIPVERAHLTRAEWTALLKALTPSPPPASEPAR